ncbi:MAG TPA: hypothetical protein PKW57_04055 [Anaerolineaceae bacterium]|nr:hypothetical protein [Anaerolineaceae bacterium]
MKHNLELISTNNQALPGFFGANIPRHAARGREEDSLLMLLSQQSGEEVHPDLLKNWLENASAIFYKSSGSVTSAMRAVVFALNGALAERNLSLPPESIPISAQLSLGVIHHDTLFIAQAGLSQALLLKTGSRALFYDADLDPRGLGLTQVPRIRFFQQAVEEGDIILFSTQFPVGFLSGSSAEQPELSALLVELAASSPLTAEVGLARVRAGEGSARWVDAAQGVESAEAPREEPAPLEPSAAASEPEVAPADEGVEAEESSRVERLPSEEVPAPAEAENAQPLVEAPAPAPEKSEAPAELEPMLEEKALESEASDSYPPERISAQPTAEAPAVSTRRAARLYSEQTPEKTPRDRTAEKAARKQRSQNAYRKLADGAGSMDKLGEGLAAFLTGEKKQSEGAPTESAELSRGTKLLLAILVPLVLVGLLSAVYFSQGRGNQYDYLMAQAQAAADNAPAMQGAAAQRQAWNEVLSWLDQAETYRQSSEARALRVRAQDALDALDGALRLVYKPAYASSLLTGLDISRIVSVGTDLYLLDKASGVVLHLNPSSGGFTPDMEFHCQPGLYEGIRVGNLIDVLSVPINNAARAPILSMDANGNGLFCGVDKEPKAFTLIPPDGGFGRIGAVLYDAGRLFILDPVKNALWIYRGASMNYTDAPDSYFEEKPVDLSEAVAAAVSGDELFLLYSDGRSSHCLASNVTGTVECEDPYPYQDARGGAEAGTLDFDALHFSQLSYSPPPDPSLYYLAAEQAELYQFSLRLNLNRVLRAGAGGGSLPGRPVTAFHVGSNRNVYLAFGSELYYAVIP